jgi:hypothetical protein
MQNSSTGMAATSVPLRHGQGSHYLRDTDRMAER